MQRHEADLSGKAIRIRLLLLDVDGVLTDGRLYYTSSGEEIKVFHVRDGMGIKLAQKAGIRVGVISGRNSQALVNRLKELQIQEVYLGHNHKLPVLMELSQKLSVGFDEIAFVGDDYVDLPILKRVGFPVAVADAPEEIKSCAVYVTQKKGGEGAVRETIEFILKLRGQWQAVVEEYYA